MIVGAWEKPTKQDKLRAAVGATQLTFDPFITQLQPLRCAVTLTLCADTCPLLSARGLSGPD